MKLATYRDGSRDGQLVVVSRDGRLAHYASGIAETLQQALDDWNFIAPQLHELSTALNQGRARYPFAFDPSQCAAPLPRAYGWLCSDTQGGLLPARSDALWGPRQALPIRPTGVADVAVGFAVVCGDAQPELSPDTAPEAVRLVLAYAMWHWGEATPDAVPYHAWGISVAPLALTPEALGPAWQDGRVLAAVTTSWNGRKLGIADGADQTPPFGPLIAAAAAGRGVRAGTVVAAPPLPTPREMGDHGPTWPRGYASLAHRRAAEVLTLGQAMTPWLQPGDRVHVEARLADGSAPFGAIDVVWPASEAPADHSDG